MENFNVHCLQLVRVFLLFQRKLHTEIVIVGTFLMAVLRLGTRICVLKLILYFYMYLLK